MKKMLCFCFLLFILTLSGCCVKETLSLECVTDDMSAPQLPAFYMAADIPHGAFLTDSCKDGCCALYVHEGYEIMQEVFPAESADEAFRYLTGRTSDDLHPIKTDSFPREEYRFSWTAAGENGPISCNGLLFYDGAHCYSLCVFCPYGEEKLHREDLSRIFTGTELFPL